MCRSGSPIPIEYLPAENTLSSRVRLLILYQGRPTTTIAVGDPLTFRLEAQDGFVSLYFLFAKSNPFHYNFVASNLIMPSFDAYTDWKTLVKYFFVKNSFKSVNTSNLL